VEDAGAIFDERDDGAAGRQLTAEQRVGASCRRHPPAAIPQGGNERRRPDPRGRPIDQRGERLGGYAAFAPETKNHRCGGAPAEGLRLRDVGNVEKWKGCWLRLRAGGSQQQR
jgi:hypothetical protein